jgi:predicted NBD/HSP70 family sugar kinase
LSRKFSSPIEDAAGDGRKTRSVRVAYTATSATIRDVNRSVLLNLIRVYQPVSRAQLSELSGIVRSNVSEIVEQLVERRLVVEKRAQPSGRGRVPILLFLNNAGFHVLAVSIRPSETTVALSGLSGEIQDQTAFQTPKRPSELVDLIGLEVRRLRKSSKLLRSPESAQIAISVPGLVDAASGSVRWMGSLPEYSDFSLAGAVEKRTGIPAAAENDCNLGALAELAFAEAERNHLKDFVFLEVGAVGVGAGIILNRELYRGHDSSIAAEFGHMVVDPQGPCCSCMRHGCWELFVCDRATWNRYSPLVNYTASRFDHMLAALGTREPAAVAALEETARYLALGISNIAFALNPELIIVAGRVAEAWHLIEPFIKRELNSTKLRVNVRTASHKAGELFLHGAVQFALSRVFARPKVGW